MTNNALSLSDMFDIGCFNDVRIQKRHVFARLDLGWKGKSTAIIPLKRRKNFKHVGYLAKGVGTKQAWGEVIDARGK